jgi:type III secretory pathway component EscU
MMMKIFPRRRNHIPDELIEPVAEVLRWARSIGRDP